MDAFNNENLQTMCLRALVPNSLLFHVIFESIEEHLTLSKPRYREIFMKALLPPQPKGKSPKKNAEAPKPLVASEYYGNFDNFYKVIIKDVQKDLHLRKCIAAYQMFMIELGNRNV